jgi:hypothetical protein
MSGPFFSTSIPVVIQQNPGASNFEVSITGVALERVRFFKKGMTRNVSTVRENRL